jgi:hypothetical protein
MTTKAELEYVYESRPKWANFRAGMKNVNERFEMNGCEPFLMGDVPSWWDFVLAGKTDGVYL